MAKSKMMHLCGFLIAGPVVHSHAIWRNPKHKTDFLSLQHYTHIATVLERGRFDFLFFADRLAIADRYGGSHVTGIRHGDQDATRMDPLPILGALSAVTSHIGLGATRSTTYDAPYNIAREFATLDHISAGRAAWNVVTSMNDGEALNFGSVPHLGHDERYDRADEFMDVAFKLWNSWESDALVLDRERGIYADPDKVHYLNHKGQWFQSRGPLNIPQSPQGRPVVIQAGSSGRGKAFAARWSEVIFALQPNLERMRRFSADVRAALSQQGRTEDASRVLMSIMPFIGKSRAEAEDQRDLHDSLVDPLVGLSTLGAHTNADFSYLPLDENVEAVQSSGSQGNLAALKSIAAGASISIAEAGRIYGRGVMCPRLVGTAKDVADEMAEIVNSGASDGFVISPAFLPDTFEAFVDGVVPILQDRALFRREYERRADASQPPRSHRCVDVRGTMTAHIDDIKSFSSVSPDRFKAVMRRFSSTVSVVTSGQGHTFNGMTATAVCSVSADPPCVLIVVNQENRSHPLIEKSGVYAVNVLSSRQQSLAVHFASRPVAPFASVAHRFGITNCPILESCEAYMECVVASQIKSGTHSIFIGRVVASGETGQSPLVYQDGQFVAFK